MSASVRPKLYNPVRDAPLYFTSHIDLRSRSGSTKRPKFFTNALYSISVLPYGGALHRGSEARLLAALFWVDETFESLLGVAALCFFTSPSFGGLAGAADMLAGFVRGNKPC